MPWEAAHVSKPQFLAQVLQITGEPPIILLSQVDGWVVSLSERRFPSSLANADLLENEDSSGGELVPKSTGLTWAQHVNFQAKHRGHSHPPKQPPAPTPRNTCPWLGRDKHNQKPWLSMASSAGHWGCRAPRHRAGGRTQQDSSHAAAQRQLWQPGCSRLLPFPPFKSRKRCGQAWEFQQGGDPTRDRWSHQMNLVLTYPELRCPPPPLRHVYIPRWKAKVTRWFTPSIT